MAHGDIVNSVLLVNAPVLQNYFSYTFTSSLPLYDKFTTTGAGGATTTKWSTMQLNTGSETSYDTTALAESYAAAALTRIASVANLSFVYSSSPTADISIHGLDTELYVVGTDKAMGAFSILPSYTTSLRSDIFLSSPIFMNLPGLGGVDRVVSHELNHSIGLLDANSVYASNSLEDNTMYTIMSFNIHAGEGRFATELQLYDIASIQAIYGRQENNSGDNSYSMFDDGGGRARIFSIWDSGGTDGIDASVQAAAALIDLRPGHFSSIGPLTGVQVSTMGGVPILIYEGTLNASIAFGAYIENVIGTNFNDCIIGNHLSNVIYGGDGDDIIFGDGEISIYDPGVGDYRQISSTAVDYLEDAPVDVSELLTGESVTGDEIYGGGGNDYIAVSAGVGILYGEGGNDILRTGQYGGYMEGGDGNDLLVGGVGDNSNMKGGDGDDILIAHRWAGMWGEDGDDIFYVVSSDSSDFVQILDAEVGDSLYWNGHMLVGGMNKVVELEEIGSSINVFLANVDSDGFIYCWQPANNVLDIYAPNGSHILVPGFSDGDLGITLGAPPELFVDFILEYDPILETWSYTTNLPYSNICLDNVLDNFLSLTGAAYTAANYGAYAEPTTYLVT